MESRSVSDNQVLSYKVFPDENQVVFYTASFHSNPHEYSDLIFDGVLAFDLEGEVFQSEIFDVDEVPIEELLTEEQKKFQRALQTDEAEYCRLRSALAGHLKGLDVRGFKVLSKGFYAWVLATDMHVEGVEHKHDPAAS